jgi:hypothetical protein
LANNGPNEPADLNKSLASYLLGLREGDRLISTREMADMFGASMGSISSALNYLEEIGAATINRRGRLGSFLDQKSYGILWKNIENGPMVIALTLPSFAKSEGMATAVYTLLDNAGIETYLIFIRGSFNRLQALRNNRCHAVVMSVLAADELLGATEEVILKLPPESFVIDHRVFFRVNPKNKSRPLRVAIDTDSFDIKYLTELEFEGCEVEFYPMTFTATDSHLENSAVDAAISNMDHLDHLISKNISSRPLSPRVQAIIGNRDSSAAFIIRSGATPTRIILQEIFKPEAILEIQKKVELKQMVPRY